MPKTKEPTKKEQSATAEAVPAENHEDVELSVLEPAKIVDDQIIFTKAHLQLIKTQIAKDASKEEYDLFMMMARRMRLDPLLKQIYFIKYGNNVSYVTSIDSYRIIAHRTETFAGVDLPVYEYDKAGKVTHASITVYKLVQGVRSAFSAKVKFSEYTTNKNQWLSKPETMIAKVAEAHALRKAFPNDLAGVYTQDEMDQATILEERTANDAITVHAAPAKKVEYPPLTEAQGKNIRALLVSKDVLVSDVKKYCLNTYKRELKNIDTRQADNLIKQLKAKPDRPKVQEAEVVQEDEYPPMDAPDTAKLADEVDQGMSGTAGTGGDMEPEQTDGESGEGGQGQGSDDIPF